MYQPPPFSPPWQCSGRSLRETSLDVVLMGILRQSIPGHNGQAVQYNTSRQISVLAGTNVSICSKLWLCWRQNGRVLLCDDHSILPAPCLTWLQWECCRKPTNGFPVLNI